LSGEGEIDIVAIDDLGVWSERATELSERLIKLGAGLSQIRRGDSLRQIARSVVCRATINATIILIVAPHSCAGSATSRTALPRKIVNP
jgi:hypothetical protein